MDFKVVERPVTELPLQLFKALERTLSNGSAVEIDVTDLSPRSARRVVERLRHQAQASAKPYRVASRFDEKAKRMYVWADKLKPIEGPVVMALNSTRDAADDGPA